MQKDFLKHLSPRSVSVGQGALLGVFDRPSVYSDTLSFSLYR